MVLVNWCEACAVAGIVRSRKSLTFQSASVPTEKSPQALKLAKTPSSKSRSTECSRSSWTWLGATELALNWVAVNAPSPPRRP